MGARRCRVCAALLVSVRAAVRPPVAMVGRRAADRVLTPRTRAAMLVAAGLAVAAAIVLAHMLRADGFEPTPAVAAGVSPDAAPPRPVPDEPRAAAVDAGEAVRAAARGRELLAAGQVKSAVSLLGQAAQALPDDASVAHLHGEALWRFGARDRALFQYERALKLSPGNAAYREALARALAAMGRPAQAARVLYGPAAPFAGADAVPPSLEGGVDLGGAGSGAFARRRSFTDADLRPRVHASGGGDAPR